jgi:hypothetical protein
MPKQNNGMNSILTNNPPRRIGRSVASVFLGFLAVVLLSLGTDQVLHVLKVYPPWGQPMHGPGLNFLALSYRCVYTMVGGYITARLAPHAAMRHVLVLAVIGFLMGTLGVVGTWKMNLGPHWYPIAIAVTGAPLTWLGGICYGQRRSAQ